MRLQRIRESVHVSVYDNDVEQALKALKKKMQRNGLHYEMKRVRHYEKPSVKERRERAEALRKLKKRIRKEMYV